MSHHIFWFVIAGAFVAAEMLSGTFYLLVFGLSAGAAAVLSWLLAPGIGVELGFFSILSLGGALLVRRYRRDNPSVGLQQDQDMGNMVQLVHPHPRDPSLWRVSYRGAEWDARVSGEAPQQGAAAFITGRDGNTLLVNISQ